MTWSLGVLPEEGARVPKRLFGDTKPGVLAISAQLLGLTRAALNVSCLHR